MNSGALFSVSTETTIHPGIQARDVQIEKADTSGSQYPDAISNSNNLSNVPLFSLIDMIFSRFFTWFRSPLLD